MVRYVNPLSEGIACSDNTQFKTSIYHPKDNIGISCVFSTENSSLKDNKPSTGIRRRYVIPKDNLGIACLPNNSNTESFQLRDIQELSEYDSCNEIYPKINDKTTKIIGRNRYTVLKDNLTGCCSPQPKKGVTISQVRLLAGGDSASGQLNADIGISNIRRPKHDPTFPRKPIVPKDNIGFSGRHLQKSLVRLSCPKSSANQNLKISSESEKSKESSLKSGFINLSEKRITTRNKSLTANR